MQAVRMFENGSHYTDVMAVLGAKRSTVLKWQALYRRGGVDALVVTPPSGRPAKLADEHLPRLYSLILNNTPRQVGLEYALWTRDLVRQLVLSEFGVDLSRVSVGRLLARIGMSPQRPLYRAYQQDPEKVRRWKEEEFPAIRAQAKAEGAALYFVDEASLRTDHHAGTTWAPSGRTPVVTSTGDRTTVNMISAVTPSGELAFDVFTGSCNTAVFIEFLKGLVADAEGRPVHVVADRSRVHTARAVTKHVESTEGELRLFFLPPYSPQLNPDEWVWKSVKHDQVGRRSALGRGELFEAATDALSRLQQLPAIVRGFFRDPDLAYIAYA